MNVLNNDFLARYDVAIALGFCAQNAQNIEVDVCINPFFDMKAREYIRYEAGTEEGVSALFLYKFASNPQDYIRELDYGYITSETNISEEEMQHIAELTEDKRAVLLVGRDFFTHARANNIECIFSHVAHYSRFDVFFVSSDLLLEIPSLTMKIPESIHALPENNGCIVYVDYAKARESSLKMSPEFARIWKLCDKDSINIAFDNVAVRATCVLNSSFGGVIGILRCMEDCMGYRYKKVIITKVGA